jgi:Uma2 family endonuclease
MSAIATPAPAGTQTPPPARTPGRAWKWTLAQFRDMWHRGYFDGRRVEFVFGEVVDMGKQGWQHAAALDLLVAALRRAFPAHYWVREQKTFPVAGSEPEPDAIVVPGSPRDYTDHPTSALLVVEVSDSTLQYDLTTKAELYATAGIADYWVLDVTNRELHVFRDPQPLPANIGATAYRAHTIHGASDAVAPLAVPNAAGAVADLLP